LPAQQQRENIASAGEIFGGQNENASRLQHAPYLRKQVISVAKMFDDLVRYCSIYKAIFQFELMVKVTDNYLNAT
jgi:hypothetical protein